MPHPYKPQGYNSLSPYLIVDEAEKLADLLKTIFGATEIRRYDREGDRIAHLELLIDGTVLMLSDSLPDYPANTTMLHLYVPDVFPVFKTALANGCKSLETPVQKEGDTDIRGAFLDFAGNYWAVSTQAPANP